MNLSCENLHEFVINLPMVQECGAVRGGALRLSTPFVYPNGEHIDVFLEVAQKLYGGYRLSDYGRTSHYLRNANSSIEGSAKKKQILQDILAQAGVKLRDGDLTIEIASTELRHISEAMLRLTHACVRISEFSVHHRQRLDNPFREGVAELLRRRELDFVPDVKVRGRFNNDVKVDFAVYAPKQASFVLLLAPLNEQASHAASNEIFRKWYDLAEDNTRRVTVYNAASPVRAEDLKRLNEHSSLISFPRESEQLVSVLSGEAA
jgi:hypothetical protein